MALHQLSQRLVAAKYILVGLMNTAAGYLIGVVALWQMSDTLPTPLIGLIATILSIIWNFIAYKMIVFNSYRNVFAEFLKFINVYLFAAILGILVLTISFDYLQVSIWVAQALSIVSSAAFSAFANFFYTFRSSANLED